MSENQPKLIQCFEYGTLRKLNWTETWRFDTNNLDIEFIDYTFIDTLDELSTEGWDLVCKGELEFIMRKAVEKPEPQYHEVDEDEVEEVTV